MAKPVGNPVKSPTGSPVSLPARWASGAAEAPFDGILRADYESGADLTVYGGSPTGTLSGGAAVSGGALDLTGGAFERVEYASLSNWQPLTVGCVNMMYKPNYSGTPATNQYLWFKGRNGSTLNMIALQHATTTGQFTFWMRQANGTYINSAAFTGAWSPTAGTTYEIELNFDAGTGAHRLFIDGTQHGDTKTGTGTMTDESTNVIRLGEGANTSTNNANFFCLDFKVWDTVQHTADY